jgi:alkanesulfonate monooxygenase SsuD/methylene tetrahydromethanopterin reductase-like flavin-dependent oxidoreductase (luciferase family)
LASIWNCNRYVEQDGLPQEWPNAPALYDRQVGLRSFQEGVEQALLGDELGFDWISLSEHHYIYQVMCPAPMLIGAYLAPHLRNAKVAMMGPTMPLNNPVRVAEELAMLDNLLEGRLIVGMLRGTPSEYPAYDANPGETRDRTIEGMELVLKAWTEPQPFSWEGRYYQFRTVSVWPRPLQAPHPPCFVLGTSRETGEFAARHHFGLGVAYDRYWVCKPVFEHYRQQCAAYGWEPTPDDILYRVNVCVAETDEQAEEDVQRYWEGMGARPMRLAVAETIGSQDPNPRSPSTGYGGRDRRPRVNFVGSPDTVIKQIRECKDEIGAGVIDFGFQAPGIDHTTLLSRIKLFGREVLPAIRDL